MLGIQLLGIFEGKGTGVTFENWTSGVSVEDNFNMLSVIIFLFINIFIYMIITLYLDQIHPGMY